MKNKGFCPRCGRLVNGEGAYEMFSIDGSLVYRHVTCPISAEMAALPPIAQPQPDYMTVAEAAALLRVSVSTIRLRIRRGTLPARRLQGGMTVLVRRVDVEGLLTAIEGVGDRPASAPRPVMPPRTLPTPPPRPRLPEPTPRPAPRPILPHPQPLPPAAPARLDAPDDGAPGAGEFDGSAVPAGLDLRDVPTALLTHRETDARGNYPGGYAVYKAEAAELDRRSRTPHTEAAAR